MPSIHGICFDEGISGNCGFECRGFVGGECDIPEEIIQPENDMIEIAAMINIGELQYQIGVQSGRITDKQICDLVLIEYGYMLDESAQQ